MEEIIEPEDCEFYTVAVTPKAFGITNKITGSTYIVPKVYPETIRAEKKRIRAEGEAAVAVSKRTCLEGKTHVLRERLATAACLLQGGIRGKAVVAKTCRMVEAAKRHYDAIEDILYDMNMSHGDFNRRFPELGVFRIPEELGERLAYAEKTHKHLRDFVDREMAEMRTFIEQVHASASFAIEMEDDWIQRYQYAQLKQATERTRHVLQSKIDDLRDTIDRVCTDLNIPSTLTVADEQQPQLDAYAEAKAEYDRINAYMLATPEVKAAVVRRAAMLYPELPARIEEGDIIAVYDVILSDEDSSTEMMSFEDDDTVRAAAAKARGDRAAKTAEEAEEATEQKVATCFVCQEMCGIIYTMQHCNHSGLCGACLARMMTYEELKCPICRSKISGIKRMTK